MERLKAICKRAVIPPSTVHALRHSLGAHLRMAGVSLADTADLMGHKDLATTQIYAKVLQEHLRSVIDRLSPLVEEAQRLDEAVPAARCRGAEDEMLAMMAGQDSGVKGAEEDRRLAVCTPRMTVQMRTLHTLFPGYRIDGSHGLRNSAEKRGTIWTTF